MKFKKHGLKVTGPRQVLVPLGKQGGDEIAVLVTPVIKPKGEERYGQAVLDPKDEPEIVERVAGALKPKATRPAKKATKS